MKRKISFGLFIILIVVIVTAVSVGSAQLSMVDSLRIIVDKLPIVGRFVDISELSQTYVTIVWQVRMPRVLLAALTGGVLAVVGAAFQGIFRNPLADPHILGVPSGAALGATVAMLFQFVTGFSIQFLGLGTIGIFAFAGALLTVALVYQVARFGGEHSTTNMLLTGTAISTLLSAIISLLMTFHNDQIAKVYMWTMGSFSAATWEKVLFLLFFTVIGMGILLFFAQKLNIILLGEDEAKCLGIDTAKLRRRIIVTASFLVAAAVSVSGIIGFVGLIIPHCVRMLCGSDHKRLMPYGFLAGATFLVICDTLARTIAAPTEIPVGIITAICGAPYFIFLVWRKRRG